MDVFYILSVILGISLIQTVYAQYSQLECIQCVHITYDPTVDFPNSQYVYDLLRPRYNPACAMQYPLDRRAYDEQMAMNNQQNNQGFNNQGFFPPNNYDVGKTVCRANSNSNKCNYIHGAVDVLLENYEDVTLKLHMHIRECIEDDQMENTCYSRDTNFGYSDIRNRLEGYLGFLSKNMRVTRFQGSQCVCNTDLCSAETSSATQIRGVSFVLFSLLISYLFSKFY